MALEIERKFLVDNGAWRAGVETSSRIVQAYVALDGDVSVRIRIRDGLRARLTVKVGQSGITRDEFEYPIPIDDARRMVEMSRHRLVEKTRHIVPHKGFIWEVDAYEGALAGLVIAEVELRDVADDPALPAWLGHEVTGDRAWSNATLAEKGLPESLRV